MIKRLYKTIWAERSSVEQGLIAVLVVVAVCFGLVFWAWMVQLQPLAPVSGTWADWVAAVGTVLGFGAAVFTLSKNARDQKSQRDEDVRAEALRVAMTVERPKRNFGDPLGGYVNYSYTGSVHNAASSPVRGVQVELNRTKLSDQSALEFTSAIWSLGTVAAGGKEEFLIQVNVLGTNGAPESDELVQAMTFLFTDVHGHTWEQTANKLSRESD